MAYRKRRRTLASEIAPVVVFGVVVEAVLIALELSGAVPFALLRLVLLVIILVVVPGGVAVLLVGGVRRARALQRYERMSLEELQQASPDIRIDTDSLTAETIFGNEAQTWFEVLLEATMASEVRSPENLAKLTSGYVTLLDVLATYIQTRWPDLPRPDHDGRTTVVGPASQTSALQQTLRWLDGIATDQASRPSAVDVTWPAWRRDLFDYLPYAAGGAQRIRISSHPELLREEIERLREASTTRARTP